MWLFSFSCTLSDQKIHALILLCSSCLFSHSLAGGGSICFLCFMSGYYNGYSCLLIILP